MNKLVIKASILYYTIPLIQRKYITTFGFSIFKNKIFYGLMRFAR